MPLLCVALSCPPYWRRVASSCTRMTRWLHLFFFLSFTFIFFLLLLFINLGEKEKEKIIKKRDMRKERYLYEGHASSYCIRSYMFSSFFFLFLYFPLNISSCLFLFSAFLYGPARLFTRAPHQIRSFRVQSCKDQTISRAHTPSHLFKLIFFFLL